MSAKTADLFDRFGDALSVADPLFYDYGGHTTFSGPIATVKVYEDNTKVREALEEPGEGRVLVIDGAGSLRFALVGDKLGELAVRNGWSGLVVYGCIRDSEAMSALPLGVKAMATNPRKTDKRDVGERGSPVTFAGVTFVPGHMLYADRDGVVVAPDALL